MVEPELLSQLAALAQVMVIDLVLAGDNAVVIGMAVAGLAAGSAAAGGAHRGQASPSWCVWRWPSWRLRLLAIVGLTLAGGLLLLWVCWKMYRELRRRPKHGAGGAPCGVKTPLQAAVQIALADISMSLDNVLAVAGCGS